MKTKKLTYDELEKRIEELEKEKRQLKKKYSSLCIYVKNIHPQDYQNSIFTSEKDIHLNQDNNSRLIPMCASCKKVRDYNDEWHSIEKFIQNIVDQDISHGLCPECAIVFYPEIFNDSSIENSRVS